MMNDTTSTEFPEGFAELAENKSTHKLYLIHRTMEPAAAEVKRELWQPDGKPAASVTLEQAIEADPGKNTPLLDHAWIGSQEWQTIARYTLPMAGGFIGWKLVPS